ncbi:MAG TPA: US12 family protein [Candidatus Onthomonas avicola]|nr:US12 family protein [Candidatus Onthomonas avicola]
MQSLNLDRSRLYNYRELPETTYNLAIGGLLLYGFVVNALICFFFQDFAYYVSGSGLLVFLVAYIVCVVLSVVLSSSPNALVNFIGYNLLVLPIGLLLSLSVTGLSMQTIQSALLGTGVFVVLMIAASYVRPDFFLSMGSTLGISLIVTVIAELVLLLLGFATGWIDYLVVAIFSLYLGFDWARANSCAPTARNAVLSATQIYLDIINIFVRLLSIISRRRD